MVPERRQRFAAYRLVFQPQVNLAEPRGNVYTLCGVEALLRSHDNIAPLELIRRAELAGDLDSLEEWAICSACEQGVLWLKSGHKIRMSINLSGPHIDKPQFATTLKDILKQTGLPPEQLTLEISERRFLDNSPRGMAALSDIRKTGVKLLRDNFGTRYAWVPDLHNPPFSSAKIARTFVQDTENDTGRAAVKAIIDLCQAREIGVVATGVETETQRDALLAMGCTVQQGLFFSPPLTPVMTELLYLRH